MGRYQRHSASWRNNNNNKNNDKKNYNAFTPHEVVIMLVFKRIVFCWMIINLTNNIIGGGNSIVGVVVGFRHPFLGNKLVQRQAAQRKRQPIISRQQPSRIHSSQSSSPSSLLFVMRDTSASYWFTIGDTVEVIQDVFVTNHRNKNNTKNNNLRGRIGTVLETWEKCDVDPTCCCAEQVDTNMAVRVQFTLTEEENNNHNNNNNNNNIGVLAAVPPPPSSSSSFFHYYFAEDELRKVVAKIKDAPSSTASQQQQQPEQPQSSVPTEGGGAAVTAFDGLSCVAFKLNQLQTDKPRGIASFEPKRFMEE